MVEWFKNLSESWQIAIFGAGVTVGLAAISRLIVLIKCRRDKKPTKPIKKQLKTLKEIMDKCIK